MLAATEVMKTTKPDQLDALLPVGHLKGTAPVSAA